jgi:hypothetical protein
MQRMMHEPACISDLQLDEWGAGELDVDEATLVEAHVAQCSHCNARHVAFESMRTDFLKAAPSLHALTDHFKVERALKPKRPDSGARLRRRRPLRAAVGGFGVVALAAIAAAVLIARGPDINPLPGVRPKGTAHLDFFVKRGKRVEPGVRGSALRPGDALRFTYTSLEETHLAIFDLDARGASVYFSSGPRSAVMPAGKERALDFSVELDAEPGDEWIHALFCKAPFDVEPLRAALAATRGLSIPKGCQLDVLPFSKVPPK